MFHSSTSKTSFKRIHEHIAIVSLLGCPYRLSQNPLFHGYYHNQQDTDCTVLSQAPYPYFASKTQKVYDLLCTQLLCTEYSKNRTSMTCVQWFPDVERFMTLCMNGELTIWSGDTFVIEDTKRLPGSSGALTTVEWLPNKSIALFGDTAGNIHLATETLSPLGILTDTLGHSILALSSSPTSAKICALAKHSFPALWDLTSHTVERHLTALGYDALCLQWHPEKALIATGSKTNQLTLWDPRTAEAIKIIAAHQGHITTLRFNPQGTLLVTAGRDTLIRLWDLRTLKCLYVLKPLQHLDSYVTQIVWHPLFSSQILISGDTAGRLVTSDLSLLTYSGIARQDYCDPSNLATLNTLMNHEQQITGIAFHPLGHVLSTVSADGKLNVWGPSTER